MIEELKIRNCPLCHGTGKIKSIQHGGRTLGVWRYKIIKKYRNRAEKFIQESKTIEEKQAIINSILLKLDNQKLKKSRKNN